MNFDNDLVVGKLRRWEKFLAAYRLPEWDAIPDFGLYMEQVVQLLKQYLDYLPPELRQTEPITAAAINNYVRTKLLPEPRKKRYYRIHIAYLIMICTLKQSLRLSMLQTLLPGDLAEEDVKKAYAAFALLPPAVREILRRAGPSDGCRHVRPRGHDGAERPRHAGDDRLRRDLKRLHEPVCGKAHAAGGQDACRRRKH